MSGDRSGLIISKILAVMAAALLILSQLIWFLPVTADAETAGDVLVVRVQYFGEIGDKVREKARFSRAELEAMGASTYYYSNITRVGTVMSMAAYGPEVMTIIEASGIDPGSIRNVTFRTTDGYTRNFTVEGHLTAKKYYYPYLASRYERNEEGNALTPLEGALDGKETVPAILALEFGESKEPGIFAEDLTLGTKKTYRFCMGQSSLTEGKMTNPSDSGGDISSMESCHSIYGIDITLSGSPIFGMSLDLDDTNIKVGSMKRVSVSLDVDEAFADAFSSEDITWTSSDESIATVNSEGEVTVHSKGEVTITATAPDGTSASITINGTEEEKPDNSGSKTDNKKDDNKKSKSSTQQNNRTDSTKKTEQQQPARAETTEARSVTVKAHEIVLGDMIVEEASPQDEFRENMAEDAQALDAAHTYSKAAAAGTAAGTGLLCGIGSLSRIIRYKRDF